MLSCNIYFPKKTSEDIVELKQAKVPTLQNDKTHPNNFSAISD